MQSVGRNAPCPCGSGKKYKKCCIDKLPREEYVYIGYKEKFDGIAIEDGQLSLKLPTGESVQPDAVLSRKQYTGKTGKERVTSSISGKAVFNQADFLTFLASFGLILATDTNTKTIGKDRVSVGSIVECYTEMKEDIQKIEIRKKINGRIIFKINGRIIFKNCPGGYEEKFTWFKLINMVMSNKGVFAYPPEKVSSKKSILIITDHDRGNLIKYNKQELPILKDFYLPENFTLVYASADKRNDGIMNMLIAECEKDARGTLRTLEEHNSFTANGRTISLSDIPEVDLDKY